MNEAEFIAALRALAPHPAARDLADDVAVLEFGGETLILTHDALVEGIHTLPGQDMADIAWKLVATNLSDLAAKGAEPLGVLLGHQLGSGDARFLEGLHEALSQYDVPLLGGDTVSGGPPRTWGMTAIGRTTCRPVPSRSGARPGDILYVTGPIGAAMAGFEALRDGTGADSAAYRRPVPLLAEGRALAPHVHAMMDISDGLLLDSQRMALASMVTIDINPALVPLATGSERGEEAMRWGDDYQLLCAAPPDRVPPIPLHAIGRITDRSEAPLLLAGRAPPPDQPLGYSHHTQ